MQNNHGGMATQWRGAYCLITMPAKSINGDEEKVTGTGQEILLCCA
jgi:hypothetical protein